MKQSVKHHHARAMKIACGEHQPDREAPGPYSQKPVQHQRQPQSEWGCRYL